MSSNEKWISVVGYEGVYEVSNLGRVRRSAPGPSTFVGRILKLFVHPTGYLQVYLYRDGNRKTVKVHRLVAQAFLVQPPGKDEVNHKNGQRSDNRVENLEWVTPGENLRHAYRELDRGLTAARGEKHGMSKLTGSDVVKIRQLYASGEHTQQSLGEMFGVSQIAIGYIVRRKTWKHVP